MKIEACWKRDASSALRAQGCRSTRTWKTSGLPVLLLCSMLLLAGCGGPGYYWQAIRGHFSILHHQRPISDWLQDPATSSELREKLRQVLELCDYAHRELGLPAHGHYTRYADLERRFVVWNVHAAPRYSLEAKTWWYPAVGRLKYRGYFSENAAHRLAESLERQGLDAYVGGVEAYSTLGWFRDPVLNTFIHHTEEDLAEILFHELAHQRVFIAGDTDFNEAFATTVAMEGTRRWLRSTGRLERLSRYDAEQQREMQFVALVQQARSALSVLYPSSAMLAAAAKNPAEVARLETGKSAIIEKLKSDYEKLKASWGGDKQYDAWFFKPINNAQLNTVATYYDLVPGFRKLLLENQSDLPRFYDAVKRLGKVNKEARRKVLKSDGNSV